MNTVIRVRVSPFTNWAGAAAERLSLLSLKRTSPRAPARGWEHAETQLPEGWGCKGLSVS